MTPPEFAVPRPSLSAADVAALEPIKRVRSRWPAILAGALTLLMIAGLARELFGDGLAALSRTVPTSPAFYLAFALFYAGPVVFDWIIFRRLWAIPVEGLMALSNKRVANEVVIGYSGEAYFYAWARDKMKMVTAPFGAVKDVMIQSAMAGNAVTLLLLAMALPIAQDMLTDDQFNIALGSAAVVLACSLPFLIFSRRVFTLERGTLWWVFGIHCTRLLLGSTMLAVAWHFGMPDVSLGVWLFLVAARLLVSRLPLVPNKDLLFANFAILVIGQGEALSDLIAFTGALTLALHVVFIAAWGLTAIARSEK